MTKQLRCDEYPMLDVDEAMSLVIKEAQPLATETVPLMESVGRIIAVDVNAVTPFPAFRCSIMDGYAVHAPLAPGLYPVQDRLLAGSAAVPVLEKDRIIYITTGSRVPEGANAVIKIEDTKKSDQADSQGNPLVQTSVAMEDGVNVRAIGSDMKPGELVIQAGDNIGPSEIGLLATLGITEVVCQAAPVVGVMSTGDELVNPWETPTGSQIRDSNRAALLTSFQQDGLVCKDLGIVRDTRDTLRERMLDAVEQCDVVVTSGGVSMGDADFVKGLLAELGTVHFGRLNMKPGKPTTYASIPKKSGSGKCHFFGLPGNPVSCLVTKTLMVDPAVRRLQGVSSSKSLHSQITVRTTQEYKLDPGRPEYHRVTVWFNNAVQTFEACSTGFQRSSRLMSMRSANGLMLLPKGQGKVAVGTVMSVLLTDPLPPPPPSDCIHPTASGVDPFADAAALSASLKASNDSSVASHTLTEKEKASGWHANGAPVIKKQVIRVGLLTISDRASQGVYEDNSGPEMNKLLQKMSDDESWPLTVDISCVGIVPDEKDAIAHWICTLSDMTNPGGHVDLILTSGGTGFGPRDLTPEAVRPILHREAPAVAQALINEGLKHTPLAVLSRPVVGTRHNTLICTLPGSVKAIRENIIALKPLLPRIMNLITTGNCSH
mmetsp:Transcript_17490/g.29317  ORF Transcript_17490/g.29317 Transcript_17490/m.29317 type:complete len:659 (-) Transcript_17490:150-2126(-)